eukprot:gene8798-8977_t
MSQELSGTEQLLAAARQQVSELQWQHEQLLQRKQQLKQQHTLLQEDNAQLLLAFEDEWQQIVAVSAAAAAGNAELATTVLATQLKTAKLVLLDIVGTGSVSHLYRAATFHAAASCEDIAARASSAAGAAVGTHMEEDVQVVAVKVYIQHQRLEHVAAATGFGNWISREGNVLQLCTQRQAPHVVPLLATGLVTRIDLGSRVSDNRDGAGRQLHCIVLPLMRRSMQGVVQAVVHQWRRTPNQPRVLPQNIVRTVVLSLLLALRFLHGQGIYHGNVKLANIMSDAAGKVHLAGFSASEYLTASQDGGAVSTSGSNQPYASLQTEIGTPSNRSSAVQPSSARESEAMSCARKRDLYGVGVTTCALLVSGVSKLTLLELMKAADAQGKGAQQVMEWVVQGWVDGASDLFRCQPSDWDQYKQARDFVACCCGLGGKKVPTAAELTADDSRHVWLGPVLKRM